MTTEANTNPKPAGTNGAKPAAAPPTKPTPAAATPGVVKPAQAAPTTPKGAFPKRPATPVATPPPKFELKINRGQRADPERVLVYGPPGIGKSTLAANAPGVVFIDLDRGTTQLDVARLDGIETWEDLLAAVAALTNDPHEFQTVALDTLDRAEWLCWQAVCKKANVTGIESVGKGYGKGYTAAYEEFRKLFSALEVLWRKRRVRIIVLAHAKLETVKNPAGLDYQRYTLKVHEKVAGMFYEVVDATLFAHHEIFVRKEEEGGWGRPKAIGGEARFLSTVEQPTHLAKNRYGLQPIIDLSWDAFVEGVALGHSPELLKATIRDRAARLGDERAARVGRDVDSAADNVARLLEIKSRVDSALAALFTPTEPTEVEPEQPADQQ